jgi:type IV pilus assembly protein PilA
MKNIKNIIRDTKKKAFTLIELLIVVAIIGILAGVGVPMYNGYMASARTESARTNHSNVKSFVSATFARCAASGGNAQLGNTAVPCNTAIGTWDNRFRDYFNGLNANPYDGAVDSTINTATPAVGVTSIMAVGDNIILRTQVEVGVWEPGPAVGNFDSILRE